jgi:hypothetical protein
LLKRKSRFFLEIIAPRRFILFAPEFADFVGDLLRSFLQKSSVSVREQNPTIPRPEVDYELDLVIYNRPKFESRLEIRLRKF